MSTPSRHTRKRQNDDESEENAVNTRSSPPSHHHHHHHNQPSSPLASSPQMLPSSPAIPFDTALNDEDVIDEEIQNDVADLNPSDEEDGDDLMEDLERDYRANPEQDHYDLGDGNIDDTGDFDEMDLATRRRIDEQLNKRDAILNNANRSRRGVFLDDDNDDAEEGDAMDQYGLPIQRRRRRQQFDEEDQDNMLDEMEIDPFNEELSLQSLTDMKAPSITEWILQPAVSRSIARELKSFFLEYTDSNGDSVYGNKMRTLGEVNAESLEVSYKDLADSKAILALFLATSPQEMLKIFDIVAMEAVELHYPNYSQIHQEIHVRIIEYPNSLNLRDLRESNMNQLVKVSGVVTRRTGVFPQLKYVKFDCLKCGVVLGPFIQDANAEMKISFCTNCQSKGPFKMNSEKTLYRNYQRITLQEAPGTVPAGRLPRHREVILLSDLVDVAKPGEEVEVTGIYKNNYDGNLNAKNGFPVFATILEANSIKRKESSGFMGGNNLVNIWTEEEEREFRKLARERGIIDKIISSIAPSIYGHKDIKTAVACSLFGGVPKDVNGKLSIRGDINVLLLGDPGTAKSQILKYVEKTASRAVLATGQGASAVGLTASVRKDPITREWTLEGGALVLADRGTCMIDEFDKMNDQDRTSIHEAMEQQTISVSKAGIVTTLQARCAIIAAANPTGGRYNSTLPLSQNVNLTEPILSRFDILCVVRDLVNPESDERLASFVVDSHMRSHPANSEDVISDDDDDVVGAGGGRGEGGEGGEGEVSLEKANRTRSEKLKKLKIQKESEISPIPQDLLVKYIQYARVKAQPKLHQMDMDKVARVYADLRKESLSTGSFPITVRHLESILRIAESFAKMRLSDFVSQNDLNRAIKVSIDSFVGTQKITVKKQLQAKFQKYTLPTRAR
ncbi:MCM2 [Candida oxycetoniae]|uniref:DNA replication licensing factor MCM2 n=1 Tax=Candida oxycetoniae TaxID=497107 RepID=A0AAI9SZR8_9ASCO|nr:MCM2 [Candida oxycetoniae]KAI3406012.2 MCM2 [Candida oxycetoniae]